MADAARAIAGMNDGMAYVGKGGAKGLAGARSHYVLVRVGSCHVVVAVGCWRRQGQCECDKRGRARQHSQEMAHRVERRYQSEGRGLVREGE